MNILKLFLFFCIYITAPCTYANIIKDTLFSDTKINLIERHDLIEKKKHTIKFLFENNSSIAIEEKDNFYLTYHVEDEKGKLIKWDNTRTKINIHPHEKKIINLKIDPLEIGKYKIIPDILKESAFWVGHNIKYDFIVNKYFDEYKKCTKTSDITCWHIEDKDNINKLNLLITRTLKSSEKNLIGLDVKGFNAGEGYSQIWIRDSYTVLQTSKYFYNEPFLSSWFEYFINNLDKDRLVFDWFDGNQEWGKNTVEADQESSLALSYFELLKIDRLKYIKHLNSIANILQRVIQEKGDSVTGLIKNAHTIDWGDVQYGFSSQDDSVDLNNKSYLVVGIYTNALFYKAVEKLTYEYKLQNDSAKFEYWNKIKTNLYHNVNKYLWNESKGFYRVHKHLTALHHPFEEDNMFGMGGNAVALSTSLVDNKKAKNIITNAINRQHLFNFSTISGALLPPYPSEYYKHPAVNKYFYYQNGGQWDWFGARLVKQMYNHGFHKRALNSLQEIAKKNVTNKGIFEWDTMTGKGKGSADYSGASGVIGSAIIEGMFGVLIDDDKLAITAPDMESDFLLNLKIPSTGKHLIYQFTNGCYNIESRGFEEILFNTGSMPQKDICINDLKHLKIVD